ncbi:glycosyltransferase, partial [Rodentibacter myodis]
NQSINQVSLSFIVPVYNVEQYLCECLDSLIHQNIDKEIIVINDGSTDNSLAIAMEYFSRYPFITLINQHNKGLSAARNIGLKAARGRYVYFIDSDDYVVERHFDAIIDLADKYQVDVLNGLRRHFSEQDPEGYLRPPESPNLKKPNDWELIDGYTHFDRMLKRDWAPGIHYSIFRTKFLRQHHISFPEGLTAEDTPFTIDVYTANENVRVIEINREFYRYRQRANSITTTVNNSTLLKDIFSVCEILDKRVGGFNHRIKAMSDPELQAKYHKIRFNIIRVAAIMYGIAYRYQYLKFSPTLREQTKHYFAPQIVQFMQQYLPYKVDLDLLQNQE